MYVSPSSNCMMILRDIFDYESLIVCTCIHVSPLSTSVQCMMYVQVTNVHQILRDASMTQDEQVSQGYTAHHGISILILYLVLSLTVTVELKYCIPEILSTPHYFILMYLITITLRLLV